MERKNIVAGVLLLMFLCSSAHAGIEMGIGSSPVRERRETLVEIDTKIKMLDAFIYVFQDLPWHKQMIGFWEKTFRKYKNNKENATEFDLMISDKIYQKVAIILMALRRGHKTIAQEEMKELKKNFWKAKTSSPVGSVVVASCIKVKEE